MGVKRPSDEISWININTSLLFRDGEEKPYAVVINFSDITDRKQAEEALRESEGRLDLAMMVKNEGIWDWNLISDETVFDDRYYTMAGYAPNEFPQKYTSWRERVHPDDLPTAEAAIKTYLSGHSERFDTEFRFRHWNGSWTWIRRQGKIVERDQNGTPLRMIGTHTNITERKRAEETLQENQAFLSAILESIQDGISVLDNDLKIRYVNPVMKKWYEHALPLEGKNSSICVTRDFSEFAAYAL